MYFLTKNAFSSDVNREKCTFRLKRERSSAGKVVPIFSRGQFVANTTTNVRSGFEGVYKGVPNDRFGFLELVDQKHPRIREVNLPSKPPSSLPMYPLMLPMSEFGEFLLL